MLKKLQRELQSLTDPKKAEILSRFFKTGKGEYGEGDIFLGITVPKQREIAKKYRHLSRQDIQKLLKSKIHECRLTSLMILRMQYQKAKEEQKKDFFDFYLRNTKYINNWDLIDGSAPEIVGSYLLNKNRSVLYDIAKSSSLWERRVAILATFWFIRNNQFDDTLKIAEILLLDTHDLIHKAVGWMLREIGKRDQEVEETFLRKYYRIMPRVMLRYAIERFDEKKRKYYLER